ncbi:MAG: hypothetical protein ACR2PZ_27225 [Pseudomonadales bacterium]
MNWDAIGAIGEVVGAAAVVITLIYLTAQVRQNNRNLEESTSSAINQSLADLNSRISSDEQFAELFLRGRENIATLTPVELERFRAFTTDLLNLAVYVDGLKASHDVNSPHFDMVSVVGSLYQNYPGVRRVIDSVEPATPRNLVERFRKSAPTYKLYEQDNHT